MASRRKQALGKGLGALLGSSTAGVPVQTPSAQKADPEEEPVVEAPTREVAPAAEDPDEALLRLDPASIAPNPRQPRQDFGEESLAELAQSIRDHGILQPLLVTRGSERGRYVLLAGERRLRAAEMAGLERVPARVIDADEVERLEYAIVENVQRSDLNPVEEARAYQALANSFGYTQEEISQRVGKSRVAITNSVRLLRLPEACLRDLASGQLTPGHARAILSLEDRGLQEQLRGEVVGKGLSVREAERRARKLARGGGKPKRAGGGPSEGSQQSLDVLALEEKLLHRLGCRVRVRTDSAEAGAIEIPYHSLDELDRVLDALGVDVDD